MANTLIERQFHHDQSGQYLYCGDPTLSLGISLNSDPCLRKTFPAVCWGLIPIPSSVMIALKQGCEE